MYVNHLSSTARPRLLIAICARRGRINLCAAPKPPGGQTSGPDRNLGWRAGRRPETVLASRPGAAGIRTAVAGARGRHEGKRERTVNATSAASGGPRPRISIVIPTYNRSGMLRKNLELLCDQTLPTEEYEVIVADDGSSDDTLDVVESFCDRLRLDYHYQEDKGFRAAAARNAGARLATSPVLVFLDTGTFPGRGFAEGHLLAHTHGDPRGRAVFARTYGYPDIFEANKSTTVVSRGIFEALADASPEELRDRYADDPAFQDPREPELAEIDFDLGRRAFPHELMWSANISVAAAEFWAVDGFDEGYRGWGMEDVDLGFKLHLSGARFHYCKEGWAIESAHDRDADGNLQALFANAVRFLLKFKFRNVFLEIYWRAMAYSDTRVGSTEELIQFVLAQAEKARGADVSDEIAGALAGLEPGARVAVFGCGPRVPAAEPGAPGRVLADFDEQTADALRPLQPNDQVRHNIGIRLDLANGSVDAVVVTSRLRGLWERFGADVLAEAARLGARTLVTFDAPPTAAAAPLRELDLS